MATRVEALINPELLVWARTTAGYSLEEAARRIAIDGDKLRAAESGAARLTFNQLKKASEVYKRPLAMFYLPQPPAATPALHDFRLQPGISHRPYSPRLNFEIRAVRQRREDVLELAAEIGEDIQPFTFSAARDEQPEEVAKRVRQWLGVTLDRQLTWRASANALKHWKAAIEGLHVLVFETSRIPLEEMRGFSIPAQRLPIIVLNGSDSPNGRIFTLLHECVHLLLKQDSVCDDLFSQEDAQTPDERTEMFCNAVAGTVLVPQDALAALLPETHSPKWGQEELQALAMKFSVSKEMMLRRLLSQGRTTMDFYRRMRDEFLVEYRELAAKTQDRSGEGGPSPAVMAVRNLGQPYIRMVLDTYAQDKISLAGVADYLGVKVRHLDRIGQLIAETGKETV